MYGSLASDQLVENRGVGLLYWWTIAFISGIGVLLARHALSKPELLESCVLTTDLVPVVKRRQHGFNFCIYFLLIGVVSELAPGFVPYLILGILPLSLFMKS